MATVAFAILLAGLAILPATAAEIGATKFVVDNSMHQELDIFSRCTWPFDPLALGPRFSAPKGRFLVEDHTIVLALAFILTLGTATMYVDFLELREETEKDHSMVKEHTCAPSGSQCLALLGLGLAAAFKLASVDGASPSCQRLPLLVPMHTPLFALSRNAMKELTSLLLPHGHQYHALMSDAMAAASLFTLCVLGAAFMYTDVQEMAADDEHTEPNKPSTHKASDQDPLPVSGHRGNKQWLRRSSYIALLLAVGAMAVTTALSAKQAGGKLPPPAMRDAAFAEVSELRSIALQALGNGRGEVPSLHGSALADGPVTMIVSILAAVGWLVSCSDLQEMEMEEETLAKRDKQTHNVDAKGRPQEQKQGQISSLALPLVLRIGLGFAMIGDGLLCAWVGQRLWLQAGSLSPTYTASHLPGITQLSAPVAPDEVTALSVAVFILIGLAVMCADFYALAQEEEKSASASSKDGTKSIATASKSGESMTWLQYMSTHWRMVSCIVLLVSMFGSLVGPVMDALVGVHDVLTVSDLMTYPILFCLPCLALLLPRVGKM